MSGKLITLFESSAVVGSSPVVMTVDWAADVREKLIPVAEASEAFRQSSYLEPDNKIYIPILEHSTRFREAADNRPVK